MGIVNYTYNRSTSGGEIITHLINSTDGQGLNFANGALLQLTYAAGGVFGTADFSIEFIIDQSSANSNNKILYTSGGSNEFQITSETGSSKIELTFDSTDYDFSYDMSADYGSPVHYVMTFDRSALATLYKDGNSVATVDISGSSGVNLDNTGTAAGYLGGVSDYGVTGVFYRWRTWKKLLSAADVTACYENASVPVVDQWTNCVTDLDFAFANPEMSLQIQSRSGAGDATASVGISQITPIEQLNSKAARIGTSAATPADGDLLVGGTVTAAALDGTLGATTPATVAATTVSASGVVTANSTYSTNSGGVNISSADPVLRFKNVGGTADKNQYEIRGIAAGGAYDYLQVRSANDAGTSAEIAAFSSTGLAVTGEVTTTSNAGFGKSPDSFASTYTGVSVGGNGNLSVTTSEAAAGNTFLSHNTYYSSDANKWRYISAGAACQLWLSDGTFAVRQATTSMSADGQTNGDGSFTTPLSISSAGLATFSNGINLGNTASATATTLDGYEEGTWTVALGGTTETLGIATGKYVRIGSLVWVSWYSGSTALASSTGAAIITGLPFAVVDSDNNYTAFTYQHGDAVDGGSRGGYFKKNSTQMNFIDTDSTNSSTFVDGATKFIMVSGVYQTTAAF